MAHYLDSGLTAPFTSDAVHLSIDLIHSIGGGENMDNDELYRKAQEWLEHVDAETLRAEVLYSVTHMERWE